jgi:hypothetical protein
MRFGEELSPVESSSHFPLGQLLSSTIPSDGAPGYGYYSQVKDRYDANRACLSQARRIVRQIAHILTGLGDDAFTIVAQPAAPTTIAR